jgi:phosphatidate cytidylyltransferase
MTGTRVLSAVIIATLLLVVVLGLPAMWSAIGLSLILVGAAWEWSAFVTARAAMRLLYVALLTILCAMWWHLTDSQRGLRTVLWAALAYWSLVSLWLISGARTSQQLIAASGIFALSFAWIAIMRMRVDWQIGHLAVLYALLIVWVADSGAYFAGRRWGGSKLAPAVSPGKTWAGLWGGLSACAVMAIAVAAWRALPMLPLLAVTLVAALYSVVGDLNESLAKRFAGVKDSGNLIPGHGGVLDRFDSLLAAAPILMLGMELLPELHG